MASTLDPDNLTPSGNVQTAKGHDMRSLGPSDSSDSGSDMAGPGLIDDDTLGLQRGTNEDSEAGRDDIANAGASVGDLDMDDTSDRYGTGSHLTAGKEPDIRVNGDTGTDRIVGAEEAGLGTGAGPEADAIAGRQPQEHLAVAAYYNAEKRGFAEGGELEDWLAAEKALYDPVRAGGRKR